MDKTTRNTIERATQQARKLLEEDFSLQLEGTFDVLRAGIVPGTGGVHLTPAQQIQREKIVAAIEHKRAAGMPEPDAITDYIRDAAFTTLNRYVALKMLETRGLVQECITKGENSAGYREFCGLAPGLTLLPDSAGFRFYIECIFDEFSTEIKVLFDRRDAASVLWPGRETFESLLAMLNAQELSGVWNDDETIGWVFQFFNSKEERQAMRDPKQGGSQAPRNSREMAVRNQFFTPRYVVQFLVDNTLGRLWIEMLGEKSQLTSKCEYFVRSTDEPVKTRPRKDPRDLRILDPACGSGHFLLYSFDLLLRIYEEAWEREDAAPVSESTGLTLRAEYPTLTNLRRATPQLIVEQNLNGVDIDPRCAQIAALVLWLRAQRAWKELGVAASERPRIERTHIVVAELMPGDAALVEEFGAQLNPRFYGDLFKKMVQECRLAGELGALLRLEDGIAAELTRAREQFVKQRQSPGFLPGMEPSPRQGSFDLTGIDDAKFFQEAEGMLFQALPRFVQAARGKAAVRRRLFAGDAEQGIALIEILRTRFDVVLMNPPFGAASLPAKKEFEKSYPRTKNDVYAAFVERGIQLLHPNGLLGAITSRTGFFLSSFQKWREEILLKEAPPVVFADLGYGVLDSAMVEVAAYCLAACEPELRRRTTFIRALDVNNKSQLLLDSIKKPVDAADRTWFEVEAHMLTSIPCSPFAYWSSAQIRNLFERLPALNSQGRTARDTNPPGDDFRFIRATWEILPNNGERRWVPLCKGGAYCPIYQHVHLVVSWSPSRNTYLGFLGTSHRPLERPASVDFFFRAGLTWSRRSQRGLSMRMMPKGCIFAQKGPAVFVKNDDQQELLALVAIATSSTFRWLVDLQMAFGAYEVGVIQRTPVPILNPEEQELLARYAEQAWKIKFDIDTSSEISRVFLLPPALQIGGATFLDRICNWEKKLRACDTELTAIQSKIDETCFSLYGLTSADRQSILQGLTITRSQTEGDDFEANADGVDEDEPQNSTSAQEIAQSLVSWAVGTVFGRFDLRLGTGMRVFSKQSSSLDALPTYSPATLTANDGMQVGSIPPDYPISVPENGILVDDPGDRRDLTTAVRRVFNAVFKGQADRWWDDVATVLNSKEHDVRKWIASTYFDYHIKVHSRSRRRAPVIWQLGVPSGRYSIWLNAYRLTRDTFFQIQNDVLTSKLAHEEGQLLSMRQAAALNPTAKDLRERTAQEELVEELRLFFGHVKTLAPLWNPNLDDGIVLTMAPLWRLVPQHKAWQKELRSRWQELTAGTYDWSHIAMHLWPERVVPKCATDRSLAIAHGLEDVFWQQDQVDKWQPRAIPTRPVEDLVRERTSPAVKAALKALFEVTSATAPVRRGARNGRARS